MRKRSHQPGAQRGRLVVWAAVGVAVVAVGLGVATRRGSASPAPALGTELDPRALPDVPLEDPAGRTVRLSSFRGRVVVLSPFLTLCAEVCPTGKLGPRLRGLLDGLGIRNLHHPSEPWTVDQLLQDVGAVLGRRAPIR